MPNISFGYDGAIPFQYLKTVVEVHSFTIRSTGRQFIFLKWDGFIGVRGGSSKQKSIHFF